MNRWPPRPTLSPSFYKGHGLGNDYLVFEEGDGWVATPENVRRVCDAHVGVGADGVVVHLHGADRSTPGEARVELRMFNPDGGEFERSGNGLRILASFLASSDAELRVVHAGVGGGRVRMDVHGRSGPVYDVSVEMGRAGIGPDAVGLDPTTLELDPTALETDSAAGGDRAHVVWTIHGPDGAGLQIVPVSVGNPHLVVLAESGEADVFSESALQTIGPFLATHPALRHDANVQLATMTEREGVRAFIWERGVGRTAASGTSACAVAVAMVATGRLPAGSITVSMPGGELQVAVDEELTVVLRGPVEEILDGRLREALLATFERAP